ncbi:hypothetical protein [Sphingopyxis bauzanensis]|uniref:hypothetical protein n=1 Tax=Sphingopyxis bauzanensis TaxID=651663 RepID=UPI0013039946|nr:hypothetical protein [Sphingopyxis bauzanensis]
MGVNAFTAQVMAQSFLTAVNRIRGNCHLWPRLKASSKYDMILPVRIREIMDVFSAMG